MRRRPHRSSPGILSWLLAAVLVATSGVIPAGAQITFGGGPQQDKNAPILFRADEIQYDEQLALTIARGHVEISQNGQVLLADTVSYNQRTDTVTASGNVSLAQPTGERRLPAHRIRMIEPALGERRAVEQQAIDIDQIAAAAGTEFGDEIGNLGMPILVDQGNAGHGVNPA